MRQNVGNTLLNNTEETVRNDTFASHGMSGTVPGNEHFLPSHHYAAPNGNGNGNGNTAVKSPVNHSMVVPTDTILLICGDMPARSGLRQFLETERFQVCDCTLAEFSSLSNYEGYSMVLIDLGTCELAIDSLAAYLRQYLPHVPVIMLDEPNNDGERRKLCTKHAFSYLIKPCNRNELLHDINLAVKYSQALKENMHLRRAFGIPTQGFELYGSATTNETQRKQIIAYAKLDGTVLITGEKGSGKGLIAQQIHLSSPRSNAPLIVVQCDALPPLSLDAMLFGYTRGAFPEFQGERVGLLELAQGGTIYFDRISEMPLSVQAKLHRFLKDRQFQRNGAKETRTLDTRILAGTRIDLALACVQGAFLEELYYRLNSMVVHLPALREMSSDIPAFAKGLITSYAKQNRTSLPILSSGALSKLQRYSWPGNLREFRNVIYRACANSKDTVITEHDITFDASQFDLRSGEGKLGLAGMTMAEVERRLIIETVTACGGNRAESARQLGVSEKTIYNKFKQYKLKGVV